jgi:hypothetical protein
MSIHTRAARPPRHPRPDPARRSTLDYALTSLVGILIAAALIAICVATNLLPAPSERSAPAQLPAVQTVSAALPATGNRSTLWVGPQAVTVSVSINGNTAGNPHVCVRNNGPHRIRLVTNAIDDAYRGIRSRMGGGYVSAGRAACSTGYYWVRARWSEWTVTAVDQSTGAYGRRALPVAG